MAGKLNGVMPAQTPTGWRSDQLSMPPPTLSLCWPLRSCGIPHANSTISTPRVSSPLASASTLPCSRVMSAAISSKRSSSNCLSLNSTRARFCGGVSAQLGKAAFAAATARATVLSSARRVVAISAPVAGLNTEAERGSARIGSAVDVVRNDGQRARLDRAPRRATARSARESGGDRRGRRSCRDLTAAPLQPRALKIRICSLNPAAIASIAATTRLCSATAALRNPALRFSSSMTCDRHAR